MAVDVLSELECRRWPNSLSVVPRSSRNRWPAMRAAAIAWSPQGQGADRGGGRGAGRPGRPDPRRRRGPGGGA